MKSKARYLSGGAMLKGFVPALLLMATPHIIMADEGRSQPEAECAEIMIKKRSVRPVYFHVERNDEGIVYKCTLSKKQYKQENWAKFKRECESFVNDYIRHFNRCQDAEIPKVALNKPREGQEKEDTERFLIYSGQIGY